MPGSINNEQITQQQSTESKPAQPAKAPFSLQGLGRRTPLGPFVLLPLRLWRMLAMTLPRLWRGLTWAITSREHYNYTYNLEPRNVLHLAAFVSAVTKCDLAKVEGYLRELVDDTALREHVEKFTVVSPERFVSDREVRYGRRMGWYALVRALKPKVVVETGVDKGLGSVVLSAALLRNKQEGHPGELLAIDINPFAGGLIGGPYKEYCNLIIADSLATLRGLNKQVDFFIHDSDHNAEFEAAEFKAVSPHLAGNALVLSDNSDQTDELLKFARTTDRTFLFFSERPLRHWWPGEGIGVAYKQH